MCLRELVHSSNLAISDIIDYVHQLKYKFVNFLNDVLIYFYEYII